MKASVMKKMVLTLMPWMLMSCASTGDEEIIEPTPLRAIKPEISTQVLWKRSIVEDDSIQIAFSPFVNNDRLFVSSEMGRVVAYKLKTGKTIWTKEFKLPLSSPVGGDGERIIIGTKDAEIISISQRDGKLVWRERVSSEVLSKPLFKKNIVVIRTGDGKLFGLNATTGKSLWTYERKVPALSLHGTGSPVAAGRNVYAGFDNGKLIAFTLQDGKIVWEVTLAVPKGRSELERMVDLDADPIIADNVIYAVSYHGRIAAIDRDTGTVIWSRELSSYSGMALDAHNVYVSDEKGYVWALYRENGATFWKQNKLEARNITAPAVQGEYIVVGDFEGYVHWLSREDGRIVARNRIDDSGITAAPVIVKDTLLARSQSGVIAAIDIKPISEANQKNYKAGISADLDEDF